MMKNIITSSGFLGAVKWNGKWFSDQEKEFSRLILPSNANSSALDKLDSINKISVSFLKSHKEGDEIFNRESLVYDLLDHYTILKTKEMQNLKVLWAYRKGTISFFNYGSIKEVSNFTIQD